MGRKAKASASGERGGQQARSDDEILKDRRLLEAFDTADVYMKILGLGMWVLAAMWFFNFNDKVPVGSSLYNGGNDTHLILIVMGFFCRWLAQASPRSWSGWRRVWHFGLCPVCMVLALAVGSCLLQSDLQAAKMPCVYMSVGLAAVSLGSFATLPGPSPKSGKLANVPLCRCLLVADGIFLVALAASILMGAERGHSLGLLSATMTSLPMAFLGIAIMLCTTEAELLTAFPAVTIFCVGAIIRSAYVDGQLAAIPAVTALLLHILPYLPLPPGDAESNPFHMALRKSWSSFVKLISQPVSGFGDDE
jgi:hypothetical protein